jgi:serine/threonine protein kinase
MSCCCANCLQLVGDEIGKGAYGRVYKGVDLQNGDFVAIKQVSLENILMEDLHSIMVSCLIDHVELYAVKPHFWSALLDGVQNIRWHAHCLVALRSVFV